MRHNVGHSRKMLGIPKAARLNDAIHGLSEG
jgi:hypothetical protein